MPTPIDYKAPFMPENFYLLTCRSIDGIRLFKRIGDFDHFQNKFRHFLGQFMEVWGYSMVTNHANFVVRTQNIEKVLHYLEHINLEKRTVTMHQFMHHTSQPGFFDRMLERQMNSFLVSYANYYNYNYARQGGLFQKPFRRKRILDQQSLMQQVVQINADPQKRRLVPDFRAYPFSGYNDMVKNEVPWTAADKVLELFGSFDEYEQRHVAEASVPYNIDPPVKPQRIITM